jgi:hypothetical protein
MWRHWWRWWRPGRAAPGVVIEAQPELRTIHVLRARWVSAAAAHFDGPLLIQNPISGIESRSDPYRTELMEGIHDTNETEW